MPRRAPRPRRVGPLDGRGSAPSHDGCRPSPAAASVPTSVTGAAASRVTQDERPTPRALVEAVLLYAAATAAALLLSGSPPTPVPVSVSTAALLSLLLVNAPRAWPRLLVVCAPAGVAVHLLLAGPAPSSALLVAADVVDAVLGATLLRLVMPASRRIDTLEHLVVFWLLAGVFAPLAGATLVALAAGSSVDAAPWQLWRCRYGSVFVAVMLLTPLLTQLLRERVVRLRGPAGGPEFGMLTLGVLLLAVVSVAQTQVVQLMLVVPLLALASLRAGPIGAGLLCTLFSLLVVGFSLPLGEGPLAIAETGSRAVTQAGLQLYLLAACAPGLAAALAYDQARRGQRTAENLLRHLQHAQDMARISTWTWDPESAVNIVPVDSWRLLGLPPKEVSGLSDEEYVQRFVHPEDRKYVLQTYAALNRGRPDFEIAYRVIRADGVERSVVEHGETELDRHGRIVRQMGTLQDVTERVESEARYRRLFEFSPVSLWEEDWSGVKRELDALGIDDADDLREYLGRNPEVMAGLAGRAKTLDVNRTTLRYYGYDDKEEFLASLPDIWNRSGYENLREEIVSLWAGRGGLVHEGAALRRDGTRFHFRSWVQLPDEYRDSWERVHFALEDCTETVEMSRRLRHLASHDMLTGLRNRYEFEEVLRGWLAEAMRGETCHALLYIDLDQFKVINDTCGHAAGDDLLRQLAGVLAASLRKEDVVARLGGDEFAALIAGADAEGALRAAETLLAAIEGFRFRWEGDVYRVGASIGVVTLDEHSTSIGELLRAADAACYTAKELGRNRVHVYEEQDEDLNRRRGEMRWASQLHEAIEQERLELYCQPICALDGDDAGGLRFEVLLRIRSREGELMTPGAFLAAAERFDLAVVIDRWVIERTLDWLGGHPELLARVRRCAINLSGRSLNDPNLREHVEQCLERNRVPAERICFEVTETAAISNLAGAMAFMKALRSRGCLFALDDFGSGLSSFGYLKSLPVDVLKIDGAFVRDMAEDPMLRAMVRSINDIGHVMGKRTVAEFVEDDGTLEMLREMGVDYAQGFGLSVPMPLDALLEAAGPARSRDAAASAGTR